MHARELVDLACVLSAHGRLLVSRTEPLAARGLEEYWVASKCRLDRWTERLRQLGEQIAPPEGGLALSVRAVIEEVLTGEVLTRVWTAVACAHDRRQRCDEAEPVARSVLIGHLEARHRVLMLLVSSRHVKAEEALQLEYLRRRVERWTDMLVGYLAPTENVGEFAFDPIRAADFARDLRAQGELRGGRHTWSLVQASMRSAFVGDLVPWSPNSDLNTRVASGILSCFPAEVFDSTGLPRSLWSLRLSQAAGDAQGMIAQLLAPEKLPTAPRRIMRPKRLGG